MVCSIPDLVANDPLLISLLQSGKIALMFEWMKLARDTVAAHKSMKLEKQAMRLFAKAILLKCVCGWCLQHCPIVVAVLQSKYGAGPPSFHLLLSKTPNPYDTGLSLLLRAGTSDTFKESEKWERTWSSITQHVAATCPFDLRCCFMAVRALLIILPFLKTPKLCWGTFCSNTRKKKPDLNRK